MKAIAGGIVVLGGAYLIGVAVQVREGALPFVYGTALTVLGLLIIFFDRAQK